ncbi:unnamed protein product [Heterosigma akashiwo]
MDQSKGGLRICNGKARGAPKTYGGTAGGPGGSLRHPGADVDTARVPKRGAHAPSTCGGEEGPYQFIRSIRVLIRDGGMLRRKGWNSLDYRCSSSACVVHHRFLVHASLF